MALWTPPVAGVLRILPYGTPPGHPIRPTSLSIMPWRHLAGASVDLFVGGVWNRSFGPESMVTRNQIITPTTVNTAHQTMTRLIVRSEASMERR